ncbi:SigE family RNA polymerase sigma factor [Kitasatospora cheerisanensis]|uniref:RNA polymerase sigma24 factor n=1 Tax=Kitasatospora cheerisanensis KCTC 2395 TaxID=1348663 RepID=A0A066Z2C7_9ACTN|nr:SigE family RNA polymerase sigma factor [Kitasatospora cheerisanensis]KDN84315.1 RNA polymerase sigma24 factor [Kitasatospora cheerisanensis KCTC 2395]
MRGHGTLNFEEYAAARGQRLYRTAYLLCGDAHRAEDLAQATLAKLFAHWRRASRMENLDAYARTVLTRTFLAEQRRRSVAQRIGVLASTPAAAAHGDADLRVTLLSALAELPARARAMVVLRYWEDLSVETVADLLGCSTGTVKSQCSRALARLREQLGEPSPYASA